MMIATGYYGVHGSRRERFTVHVVQDGRPLCGWRPGPKQQFQWCAWGVQWSYLECHSCRRLVRARRLT